VKEAALLNSTKGHRNIIQFLGFCEEPYSIIAKRVAKSLCISGRLVIRKLANFAYLLLGCFL
jgi:hypothetical protein